MPELPEVEHLRATLEHEIAGWRVSTAVLLRPDMLVCGSIRSQEWSERVAADALLQGRRVDRLARHGKQLALIADDGTVLCIQLGMTGRVVVGERATQSETHTHARWSLEGPGGGRKLMTFADPRRFGCLTSLPSESGLMKRWSVLGPDAATVDSAHLQRVMRSARRSIKVALLDQELLAGIGNIYADEALFRAGISPRTFACRLLPAQLERLAFAIRDVLGLAIASGGSSLRDYVDANGRQGGYQDLHLVYGRAGEPCRTCATTLRSTRLGGRQTVWCPTCQSARPKQV